MKLIVNSLEHLDSGGALVHYTITKDEKYFHNEGKIVITHEESLSHADDIAKLIATKLIQGMEENLNETDDPRNS